MLFRSVDYSIELELHEGLDWRASRTMFRIFWMFSSRNGQVLSVATHCAVFIPQPQVQRERFAALSASRFWLEVNAEKSTTLIALSSYGTPDRSTTAYPINATNPPAPSHLTKEGTPFERAGRRSF